MKRVLVVLMAVLLLAGCSESSPRSSGDNAPDSPGSGVAKDSPADVNSTKDMTGVVMEYPPGKNPYFNRMPDVCKFIPDSLMKELGMIRKKTGFDGSGDYFQSCEMFGTPANDGSTLSIGVGMYAENFSSLLNPSLNKVIQSDIPLNQKIKGTIYIPANTNTQDFKTCSLIWGTFYGAADIDISYIGKGMYDTCKGTIDVAMKIAPQLPTAPNMVKSS